jgi:hypothetical protein
VILVKIEILTAEDGHGRRLDDINCSLLCSTLLVLSLWSQIHSRSHSFDLFLPAKFAAILLVYPKFMQELQHLRHTVGHLLANMSHTVRKHNSRPSETSPYVPQSLVKCTSLAANSDSHGYARCGILSYDRERSLRCHDCYSSTQ